MCRTIFVFTQSVFTPRLITIVPKIILSQPWHIWWDKMSNLIEISSTDHDRL